MVERASVSGRGCRSRSNVGGVKAHLILLETPLRNPRLWGKIQLPSRGFAFRRDGDLSIAFEAATTPVVASFFLAGNISAALISSGSEPNALAGGFPSSRLRRQP